MRRYRRSRLVRKEARRNLRRAVVFGFLTVLLAFVLIFLGIPALIRMAIFLGNLRSSSLPVETGDIVPPAPPRLAPLPEATNSARITVQGFSEPGSVIEIFLDGSTAKETVTEEDGSFRSDLGLSSGRNEISVIAKDEVGNTSQRSARLIVFYDNEPPELELDPSVEGTEYSDQKKEAIIKGKTEEGVRVTINDRMVIVDSQGNFEYPLLLSEGENPILIRATDKAGNQTEKEITLTYTP